MSEEAADLADGLVHPPCGLDKALTEIARKYARGLQLELLGNVVSVVWNARLRSAAGRACMKTWMIEMNPKLQALPEEQRGEEIKNTFLHELAHLVAFERAAGKRIQPHGPEWRQACADLGIPEEDRCHSLDFKPRRMKRRFAYACPNCGAEVHRVRRVKRAVACHPCCHALNGGKFDSRFQLVERLLS